MEENIFLCTEHKNKLPLETFLLNFDVVLFYIIYGKQYWIQKPY